MKKNNLLQSYSALEIAENMYLIDSYREIIRAARLNKPLKDVQWTNEDLRLQLMRLSREELIEFDNEVSRVMKEISVRNEIQTLRNQISNKKLRIKQLENEIKND